MTHPPASPGDPGAPLPPHRFGEPGDPSVTWVRTGHLGEGGMGEVYAAQQRFLDRLVAVKVVRPGLAPSVRARLNTEARVMAALDHPAILPIYDRGLTTGGDPCFAMPLVRGHRWDEVIGEDLARDVEILIAIAQAAGHAHRRGVIHRDIKPANVLLGDFAVVLLVDWGLAAGISANAPAPPPGPEPVGTMAYAPPEMADPGGRVQDHRADIFLLGATLWHIVTGDAPHPGETSFACHEAARENRLLPPAWEVGGADPGEAVLRLAAIARRAMATDPADRHPDAAALVADLEAWRRTRSSMDVLDRARRTLDAARDPDEALRAIHACDEALGLWPGCDAAREVRRRARIRLVGMALARGDLDQAGRHIDRGDPGHAELVARLADERIVRGRQVLAEARLGAVEAEVAADTARRWAVVADLDFTRMGPAELAARCEVRGMAILDGRGLTLRQGWPSVVALRQGVPGDVRVTVEVEQPSTCDDLTLFLAADPTAPIPRFHYGSTGYEFKFGWRSNTVAAITRARRELFRAPSPGIRPRVPLTLRAQRVGRHLGWELGGRSIAEVCDLAPIARPGADRVGFWSFLAPCRLRRLLVESLGQAPRGSLLDLIEYHLDAGHDDTATHLLADAATVPWSPAQSRRLAALAGRRARAAEDAAALARAVARVGTRGAVERDGRGLLVARLAAPLDPGPDLAVDAVVLAPAALPAGTPPPLRGVGAIEAPDAPSGGAARWAIPGLRSLAVPRSGLDDLSPLAGLPLEDLDISGCPVADLGPLAGAPLRSLAISGCPVAELGPLAGAPLQRLDARGTRLRDLSPLAGSPLRELDLSGSAVTGLEAVAGMPLEALRARELAVTDLPRRLAADAVGVLDASWCRIARPRLPACRRIENLVLDGNPLADLSGLAGAQLNALGLDDCPPVDLRLLRGSVLGCLFASRTRIDLRHLEGWSTGRFDLEDGAIRDPGPLAGTGADHLALAGNPIADLAGLAGMDLDVLDAWHPGMDPAVATRGAAAFARRGRARIARQLEDLAAVLRGDREWLRRTCSEDGLCLLPVRLARDELPAVLARLRAVMADPAAGPAAALVAGRWVWCPGSDGTPAIRMDGRPPEPTPMQRRAPLLVRFA